MSTLYVGSGESYTTLQAAIDAAQNGDTIILKEDVTAVGLITIDSKDITVDLGGFTLDAQVHIKGDADVEFKNGSMTYTNTDPVYGSSVITTGVYTDENGNTKSSGGPSALTLTGVKVEGGEAVDSRNYTHAVYYKSTGGLTITDCTITGGTVTRTENSTISRTENNTTHGIYASGCDGDIVIKNSTISGGYGNSEGETRINAGHPVGGGDAIYLSGKSNVTIENSTVSGGSSKWYNGNAGINVTNQFSGTLTVVDSTVTGGTAEGKNPSSSTSGIGGVGIYTNMSTSCQEIAISGSTISGGDGGQSWNGSGIEYRNANIKLTITGSTVEAGNGEDASATGSVGALMIANSTSTQIVLDDVELNGEGNGNAVIKGGDKGVTFVGPVEVVGGTLENVKVSVDATGLEGTQAIISGNVGESVEVTVSGNDNATVVVDGGKTYITTETDPANADKSVIYVNNAWAGANENDLVGVGKFFGVNAFTSFVTALDEITADTTAIEVAGDVTEDIPAENKEIILAQDFEIRGEGTVTLNNGGYKALVFAGADVKVSGVELVAPRTQVFFGISATADDAAVTTGVEIAADALVSAYVIKIAEGSTVNVLEGGKFFTTGEVMRVEGTLNASGNAGFDAASETLTADDRQTVAHYSWIYGTENLKDNYNTIYSQLRLIGADSKLNLDNARLEVGKTVAGEWLGNPVANGVGWIKLDGAMTLDNGSVLLANGATGKDGYGLTLSKGAGFTVANGSEAELSAGISNMGTVNVDGGTLTAGTNFAGAGTQAPNYDVVNSGDINVTNDGVFAANNVSNVTMVTLSGLAKGTARTIQVSFIPAAGNVGAVMNVDVAANATSVTISANSLADGSYTVTYVDAGQAFMLSGLVEVCNGKINVNGGIFTADSVAVGKGTFDINGASSVNVAALDGVANVKGGTLTDSVIGGVVAVTGDTTFGGTNDFSKIWVSGGTLTVDGDLVTKAPYPAFFVIGNDEKVNANEKGFYNGFIGTEAGEMIVNGSYTAEEGVVGNGGKLTVNGEMTANCLYLRGGETTVAEGGSLTGIVWSGVDAGASLVVDGGTFGTKKADGLGSFSNAGTFTVKGSSTLDIVDFASGTLTVEDATTLTDSTVAGAGYISFAANGTTTFEGENKITAAIDNSVAGFDFVVNEGASLLITRYTLGYDRNITVKGTIEDATALETLDGVILSLKANSTSGFSIGGWGTSVLDVDNAYVDLGKSTWKNATGTYTWNFTNSYVTVGCFGNTTAGSSADASWVSTFDDSVLVSDTYLKTGKGMEVNFTNGSVATIKGSMRIDGVLNIDDTSSVSVNGYFNAGAAGAASEHSDILGTVNVAGTMNIKGTGPVELIGGSVNVLDGGTLNLVNDNGSRLDVLVDADSELNIDGNFTAGTITNNGAFAISGESTVDVGLIKGNDVTVSGTLKDSNITFETFDWETGNAMVDGELVIDGGTFKNVQFRADEGEKVTLEGNIVAAGATQIKAVNGAVVVNGSFTSDQSEASSIELEGDDSTLTINEGSYTKITGGFYLNGGTTVINGELTADADKKALVRTDADVDTAYATWGGTYAAGVTLNNAYVWNAMISINNADSEIIVDNSRLDGWMSFDITAGTLIAQNGSFVNHQAAEGWTWSNIGADAAIILTDGSIFDAAKTNLTFAGSISVDATSSFIANTLTGEGTITIDATGFTEGINKVIDLNGTSSLEGKVTVNGLEDGTQVFYLEDGDVVLSNADLSKLYVSSEYAGKKFGDDLGDGKFFGINSFADFDSAVELLPDNNSTIYLFSDAEMTADPGFKLNVVSGDGEKHTLKIDSVIDVDAEFAKEIDIEAPLFMGYYNNHQIVVNGDLKGGFYNYTGSMTFNNSKITDCWDNSNIGGVVTINGDGSWTLDNAQAENLKFINVGRSDWLGQGILNLNDTVVKAIAFDINSSSADAKSQINVVNSTLATVLNDGLFGNITVGANGEINLTNSDMYVVGTLINNGAVNVTGEGYIKANVSGNGITLNNATLTADSNISGATATKIYGNSTIYGTVGIVHANWTGAKENGLYAGYTTDDVALTLDGATTGNVYVGSDTEGYAAALTVKGGSKVGGIYERVYGSAVITGSDNVIDYISAKGSIAVENAANTTIVAMVAEGAQINITDSEVKFAIGTSNCIQLDGGTVMTITGSEVEIQQMTIDAASALKLTNSTVTVDDVYDEVNLITNNGSITIDALSTLTADSIANNGTITIDATGFTGTRVKVIDLNQAAALSGVKLKGTGYYLEYAADGDVSIVKSPDTIYVSSDYNSTTEGWGYNKFGSINSAENYAVTYSPKATVIVEKTTTVSGNSFQIIGNKNESQNGLKFIIKDGALAGNANSKWDMVATVTVEAGGKLVTSRPLTASAGYVHAKDTLTLAGDKENGKYAILDFGKGTHNSINFATLGGGKVVADYADATFGDFSLQAGSASFTDSVVTVEGALSTGVGILGRLTLTGTTVNVNGHHSRNDTYFKGFNQLKYVTMTDSSIVIDDGAEDTVADNVTLHTVTMTDSEISVEAGTDVEVTGKVTMNDESLLRAGKITLAKGSNITMDIESTIEFTSIVTALEISVEGIKNVGGTITVSDAASYVDNADVADGTYKLLDYTGDAAMTEAGYKVLLNDAWHDNYMVFNNDLYLTDQDTSLLRVSAEWKDAEQGSINPDGSIIGFNAFAKVESIADKIKTDGSDTTVKFESNIEVGQDVEFICGDGDLLFTADSAVTVSQKGVSDFGIMNTDTTVTVGENVTFQIYDNASGWYQYYGPSLELYGTITGGQNWGCTYLFNGEHTVHSTGTLSTGRVQLGFTTLNVEGDAESERTAAHIDTNYLLVEGSTFNAENAIVEAGIIYDSNNGGMRWGASEFYFNGSKLTGNMTIQYAESIVEFNNSDVTLGTLTNAGSVTVDGASTLNITKVEGNAINVIGGTLSGSTIGSGFVAFTGDAALEGENTLGGVNKVLNGSTLTIDEDADVTAHYLMAGEDNYFAFGNDEENKGGTIDINGKLTITQNLNANANGIVNINEGAEVKAAVVAVENGEISDAENAGVLNVDGKLQSTFLNVFSGGTANINEGGYVQLGEHETDQQLLQLGADSTVYVAGELNIQGSGTVNGALNVAGGELTVSKTLANNGTVTVTGESTVNVGTLSGTYIRIENGTLVGESNIGGNIRTYEDFALAGTLTVKQTNMYGTSVVKNGAVFNGGTTIVSAGGEFTLENGGTINSRFFNVIGNAEINGEINLLHSDPRQKLLQVIQGGVASVNEGAVITIDGHNAIVNAGGTLNINGGTLNITMWEKDANEPLKGGILYNDGTVALTSGTMNAARNIANTGTVAVSGGTLNAAAILNNGTVTVTGDSTLNIGGAIANNGTITVDAGSKIFAQDITGNGTIMISDTGFTGGFVTLIDLNGSASLKDRVVYDGEYQLIFGTDGDVTLHNISTETIYVNDDWTGKQFCEEVEEGKFYGINAWADIDTAVAVAAGSAIVAEIVTAEGSNANLHVDVTTANPGGLLVNMGNNGISFDKNGAYTLNGSTDFDTAAAVGAEIGWTANDITIGENVTVNADVLVNTDNALRNIEGVLNVNGVMVRSADKADLIVSGELNVADNFVVTKGGDGGKTTVEDGGELTVDSIWVKAESYSFNIDGNAEVENFSSLGKVNVGGDLELEKGISDIASLTASGKVDISEGADVTVGDVFVDKGGVIELDNAVLDVTTGMVLGDINVTDSTFTAEQLALNGCYIISGFQIQDSDREVTLVFFEKGSSVNGRAFQATVKAGEDFARFINDTIRDGEYDVTAVDGNNSIMVNFNADDGDFNVYGNSSVSVKELTGKITINENAKLSASEVKSGTVAVIGNAEMAGTNTLPNMYIAGTNADGSAATVVVDENSTLNASIVSVGGTEGKSDFDKQEYFGGYYNNVAGAMDIAGTFNTDALALYKDGKMTVSGTVKAPEFYLRDASAVAEVEAGGTVTSVYTDVAGTMNLAGTLNVKGFNGEHFQDNVLGIGGKLSVNGGTINSNRGITVYEGGELDIANGNLIFSDLNGNDSKYNGKLTANGSVNVTGESVVKIDTLAGTINVDDADLTGYVSGGTLNVTGESTIGAGFMANNFAFGTLTETVDANIDLTGLAKADFAVQNGTVDITGKMDASGFGLAQFRVSGNYNTANGLIQEGDLNAGSSIVNIGSATDTDVYVKAHQVYISETGAVNKHTLNVYGELEATNSIFNKYNGELDVYGKATANYLQVAGNVTVTGEGAQLNLAGVGSNGAAKVGIADGSSKFTISNGATLDADGVVLVGYNSDRNGEMIVDNATVDASAGITVAADSTFTIKGESTVKAAVTGNISLAGNVTLTDETAISIAGDVTADGDVEMKHNAITGATNFTVKGTLSLSDVVLPAANGSITLVEGKGSFGGLSINGDKVVDNALFFVNGNDVEFYNVTYGADKVTLDSVVYAGMSGAITGVSQQEGTYSFTVTPEIAGSIGDCTYSTSVYDANGKEIATAAGLTVTITDEKLLNTKLNFKVTVTDELGSDFAFTTNAFTADVKDYTGPLFTAAPAAVVENGKLQLSWEAFDAFGLDKYIITINGKKTTIDAYEKMTFGQNAIAGTNIYSIVAVDKNGNTSTVEGSRYVLSPAGNISGNAVTQIVGYDAARGAVGYIANEGVEAPIWKGIWEWGADSPMKAVALGSFEGTDAEHAGLLFYNEDTFAFGAWTDIADPNYGYVELGNAGSAVEVEAIGNFDGNEYDDILVEKEDGSIGIMTDVKKYTAITSGNAVELAGAGSFGAANGLDSIVVEKNGEFQLWNTDDVASGKWNATKIMNADNQQLLDITGNWEVSAIGDFKGDGIDDIIMTAENGYSFLLNDGKTDSVEWSGAISPDFEVAGVGDYNGDGTEDLLLREMTSGWGGLGYWNGGNAGAWVDLNARIETSDEEGHSGKFSVITVVK